MTLAIYGFPRIVASGAQILARLKLVDGVGSGLDTDLVQGVTPGAFGLTLLATATKAAALTALTLAGLSTALTGGGSAQLVGSMSGANQYSLPDQTGTLSLLERAQTFTQGQTVQAAAGILTRAAATQDGVALLGRAGGSSSRQVQITVPILTATRTATLLDADVILAGSTAALTAGGVPYIATGGLLAYDSQFLWDTTNRTLSIGTGSWVTTAQSSLRIGRTITDASNCMGVQNVTLWTPSGASAATSRAGHFQISLSAANGAISAGLVAPIAGVVGYALVTDSTNLVTAAAGGRFVAQHTGAGTVTNLCGITVDSPTNSGGGTVSNAIGLYINAQTVGATNYAIFTNSGIVRFNDVLQTFLTSATNSAISTTLTNTSTSGTLLAGTFLGQYAPSGVTTANYIGLAGNTYANVAGNGGTLFGGTFETRLQASATGTYADCRSIQTAMTNQSAATITAARSIFITSATNTGGGAISTNIGLDVAAQTAGGVNYSIRTNSGLVNFGDIVGISVVPVAGNGLMQLASGTTVANALRFGETPIYRIGAGTLLQDYAQNANTFFGVKNGDAGASATARFIADNGTTQAGFQIIGTGGTDPGSLLLYTSGTAPIRMFVNGGERARIYQSGGSYGLLVGITTPLGTEAARFNGGAIAAPSAADVTIGGGRLSVGGSTLTVGINTTAGMNIIANGAVANNRTLLFQTAGVDRWAVRVNAVAEAGADAGSNFELLARTDLGAGIDTPLTIVRAAGGAVTITRPVTIAGLITTGSAILMASSVALTNGAAAAAGTLANAPTAGNPTKWIPINDNGTTRYIPAW